MSIRGYLGKPRKAVGRVTPDGELSYARYGLFNYVLRDKQRMEPYSSLQRAGANLRGLMRVLLFKRFESSVEAFRKTVAKLIAVHEAFLKALQQRIVAAGEEAQSLLYASDAIEEEELMDALRSTAGRYKAADFNIELLQEHIEHDLRLLRKIKRLVEPITPGQDAKLQELKRRLSMSPLKDGKRLIFTQFADTAQYLFDNLNPAGRDDIDVIYSGDKSRERLVGRFAPKANPEYRFQGGESELTTVVATDVLAEGLNLQDCDKVINYDLHWNPVKLIQRFGRIDRIGSEHDRVYGFNFLPERGIDRNLGLTQTLKNRIQEIHDTIGEDSAILDASERLNEEAMYAIYEQRGEQLALFEDDDGKEDLLDLNEAEEIVRQLRAENPTEYQRIEALRDGIRSGKRSTEKGTYVFCEAKSPLTGDVRYRQLLFSDAEGTIVSRDVPKVLALIRCQADEPALELPHGHNAAVMRAKAIFEEEVKNRWAEQKHSMSLGVAQRYVLRELRVLFSQTDDEDLKAQINVLAKVFGASVTTAVKGELNRLRRNGVLGHELVKVLGDIYYRHGMSRWVDRFSAADDELPVSRIICSEALL